MAARSSRLRGRRRKPIPRGPCGPPNPFPFSLFLRHRPANPSLLPVAFSPAYNNPLIPRPLGNAPEEAGASLQMTRRRCRPSPSNSDAGAFPLLGSPPMNPSALEGDGPRVSRGTHSKAGIRRSVSGNLTWVGIDAAILLIVAVLSQRLAPSRSRARPRTSPRPLEFFNRERQGGRRLRHAAELDHEVRGGRGVGGLENHDRVRLPEEAEELVHHDVVRKLRVLEQAGGFLKLAGEDPELRHEEHGRTGIASRVGDI